MLGATVWATPVDHRLCPIERTRVNERRRTTAEEARRVGDAIGVDWDRFDLEQFRAAMDVEFEHGSRDPQTDVPKGIDRGR
jgi:hypothetical protein